MFMPLLTSVIIFVIFLQGAIRRSDARKRSQDAAFFRREHEANFVRKKSLDGLDYIHIPLEELPFGALPEDADALDAERAVRALAERKIVNLTGLSNTDLKLRYGTANITPLTEYDTNYLALARALQKWGRALYAHHRYEEAFRVLSFAIDTRTDVSQTWHLYIECARWHAGLSEEESRRLLQSRIPLAESLEALSRDAILAELRTLA